MVNIEPILKIYRDLPAENGDLLLVTDHKIALPIESGADIWSPQLLRGIADALRSVPVTEVHVAISRPDSALLPQDQTILAELREALRGAITVHGVIALPAA